MREDGHKMGLGDRLHARFHGGGPLDDADALQRQLDAGRDSEQDNPVDTGTFAGLRRRARERSEEKAMAWKPIEDLTQKELEVHVELLRETVERLAARLSVHPLVIEDLNVRGGIPTLRGTRLGALEIAAEARVISHEDLLETYPTLTRELIAAALEYEMMFRK